MSRTPVLAYSIELGKGYQIDLKMLATLMVYSPVRQNYFKPISKFIINFTPANLKHANQRDRPNRIKCHMKGISTAKNYQVYIVMHG